MGFWHLLLILTLERSRAQNEISLDSPLDTLRNYELVGQDIFFEIIEPEDLRFTYRTRPANNFGAPFNSSFYFHNAKLVLMDPPDGCTRAKNDKFIYGNVAFIERGSCSFIVKTSFAEEAGAKAVIITDNEKSESNVEYLEMIDDKSGLTVSIPATFLLGKNGFIIRDTLKKLEMDYALINIPVNLTNVPLNQWKQPPWLAW